MCSCELWPFSALWRPGLLLEEHAKQLIYSFADTNVSPVIKGNRVATLPGECGELYQSVCIHRKDKDINPDFLRTYVYQIKI
jgi:hypothetical protein